MEVLNVVAIIVAATLVGAELAVSAFVHPTLDRLPDDVHLPAAIALARCLGKVMPFWYVSVVLLTLAETLLQWRQTSRLPLSTATSTLLWALTIAYSLLALVPVNNRIASWEPTTAPPNWKSFRQKWDARHRLRVALLTTALALLIIGINRTPSL
jgi:uncharacterized membrane protein